MKRYPLQTITIVGALAAVLGTATTASGYSTKLHMITGRHLVDLVRQNNCRIPLQDWNQGRLQARPEYLGKNPGAATYTVQLNGEFCRLIKTQSQYFVAGTTGPDTFPGMFGNTDPTHALLWNTAWQIQVLWQNARTEQEKAFVLGWLVHFAGDLNAHGLANMHAHGVWMSQNAKDKLGTVWKHILAETYYAKFMLPYPKGFDNTLVWPQSFVKKMFFNPNSPLYQHYDFLLSKSPTELGAVAKAFGAVYRVMFLLWDFHGREMHKWRGRTDYYKPRKTKSVGDFFHWLFADQAYNLHKKKLAAIKDVIDRWYEATARAQQAIVADRDGRFTGKKGYDKVYFTLGVRRVKPNHYSAGGMGGLVDAYKYLGEAIFDYLSPNLITITNENAPGLRKILDGLKKVGAVAVKIIDGIKAALRKLKDVLAAPFKAIGHAIKKLLDPLIQKAKDWFAKKVMCNRMPAMCKAIDAQQKAFGIVPGRMETYMNWPVYRNSITAGALMLEKLQTMDKNKGFELTSPAFGLPSGDFGCTGACTAIRGQYARLFMPMAGKYYVNGTISSVMPDYCMMEKERRRNLSINEDYRNKTNDEANDGFTCFEAEGGGVKVSPRQGRVFKGSLLRDGRSWLAPVRPQIVAASTRRRPQPRAACRSLRSNTLKVCLRTFLNRGYVQVLSNNSVRAAARSCSPNEVFTLVGEGSGDGKIRSGELVRMRAAGPGYRYLSARPNGTVGIAQRPGRAERFQLRLWGKANGIVIKPGDRVFFGSAFRRYLSAIGGGGREVRAHAPRAVTWESFILVDPRARSRRAPPATAAISRPAARLVATARPAAPGGATRIPGSLAQVSVGGPGQIWGVNRGGAIYQWNGRGWQGKPGRLRHVSVGADGTVWGVNPGGAIFRWSGRGWQRIPGGLVQISVGNARDVWGVNGGGAIFKWTGRGWQRMPGSLRHVSAGADGTVWGVNRGGAIFRWRGRGWQRMPGRLAQISVGKAGQVWGATAAGDVYRWAGRNWIHVRRGITYVATGPGGTVWGLDRGNGIWRISGAAGPVVATPTQPAIRPGVRPARPLVVTGVLQAKLPCNDAYASVGKKTFKGKIGEFFQKIYDSVVGRWDFRTHPATRGPVKVRSVGSTQICYPALGYDQRTIAPGLPDPDRENQKYYQRASYSLKGMLGNLFQPLGELFLQGANAVMSWAKNKFNQVKSKVCRWVTEKVVGFLSDTACKIKCKARSLGTCKKKVWLANVPYPCFQSSKYNACRNSSCKTTSSRRKQVCN